MKSLSLVRLYATPWTVACQVPPSMGFSRQDYWSGLPFPSPGDLPDSGTEPGSLELSKLNSKKKKESVPETKRHLTEEDMTSLLKNI